MGLKHLICACVEVDTLHFGDIYDFRVCETLSTEMGSFYCAALASFAKLFAIVSKYYAQDCLKSIKCSFPENWGMQKNFMLLSFQKTSLITLLGQKKAIKVRFSPIKWLFIFMRFPNFQKLIYCGKKVLICCFWSKTKENDVFLKKIKKKNSFAQPVSRKLAFYIFSEKSIKCSFPENWGMQKKFHVTFFSKNVSCHTFRPEKSNQSTFFTHKIAFYFSEISKFPEIDLLRKKRF